MNEYWDKKILLQFEDLKMLPSFLKTVAEFRKKHKIPSIGFKVNDDFTAYTKIGAEAYMEILADWRLFLRDHRKSRLLASMATEFKVNNVVINR